MEISIEFTVNGTIHQTIKLADSVSMSEEDFKNKLKKGEILTTISRNSERAAESNKGIVYDISNGVLTEMGKVIYQEACDDMEFYFETEEDC